MIVDDDSDARMLRRVKSFSQPAVAENSQTMTPSTVTNSYSPGDWRKAEEASNKTGPILPPPIPPYVPPVTTIRNSDNNNPPPPQQVSPIPLTPSLISSVISTSIPVPPVKTAPIDTILFNDDSVPVQIMADLIFENIGGQELINIARNDTINGQTVIYQPIKNLTQIQQQYNPNNIVSLQSTSDKYFQNFSIKFDDKVPNEPTGPGGEHVYIDPLTGELIVEAVNLAEDEQIEVEITISGTIYEAEL